MVNFVKVWTKEGEEIASFEGSSKVNHHESILIIRDLYNYAVVSIFNETMTVSVEEQNINLVLEKLKTIFKELKQTIIVRTKKCTCKECNLKTAEISIQNHEVLEK
jgi:hypothetical protein